MSDYLPVLCRRAFAAGDPALLQLAFHAAVLDRYRGDAAFRVIRTDTAGRITRRAGWSLDFGIAAGDRVVHASWGALSNALPEGEREHWSAHAVASADLSDNFIRMQLAPASCFDDGDVRAW
jgi:hypothetical protein